MTGEKRRRFAGIILSAVLILFVTSPPLHGFFFLPSRTSLMVGESMLIRLPFDHWMKPYLLSEMSRNSSAVRLPAVNSAIALTKQSGGYCLQALKPGRADVCVKVFGYIPVRSLTVETLPPMRVVPGGHSIGIMLQSKGIMVVGTAPLQTNSGEKIVPARQAGIESGDLILSVNGQTIFTESALADAVDKGGRTRRKVNLVVKRESRVRTIPVNAYYCAETGRYRIGLFVRDGVAGVGTLSFWDPQSYRFGALGHVILETDTKNVVNVRKGRIVSANVQGIQPGQPGRPGQKIGIFDQQGAVNGSISTNSYYGVFGVTHERITNRFYPKPIPVAYAHQVRRGPAEILTVVDGSRIERFSIMIEKVYPYRRNGKGMVIKVTDSRLLPLSGGIVQGMSGSPIIQNHRIIGAVTHVFLNNPTKGYGIFMDSMVEGIRQVDSVSNRQIEKI